MKSFMSLPTESKLFPCYHCPKVYKTKFSLKRHMRKYYSNLYVETEPVNPENRITPRVVINARHYEKTKERRAHRIEYHKLRPIIHIEMLEERIAKIAEGCYDKNWPVEPQAPSGKDLNEELFDSKALWERYDAQMKEYRVRLHDFTRFLKYIPFEAIIQRVTLRMNEFNVSKPERVVRNENDESDIDSHDSQSGDEDEPN